ncbi:hypothetical protein AQUCO_00100599v1 [Aquilegia coerulea]|uniref:F-box domain-containing protein n=1 Tax=Aquilegia coerulea TaxID=218851 RepID=A0A2G5FB42_AQUCA|nr:hypothetical protein AQUCO_00100599v1 [Aquilegia coerulea]
MELIPGLLDDIGRECLARVSYKEFSQFFHVCKAWKAEIVSRQFHQFRKTNGFSRNIVVLTQDSSSGSGNKHSSTPAFQLSVYEPETGSWSRLPAIPGYSDGIPLFCRCAGVGHYLVLIGGWNPTSWKASNTVFIYDFVSDLWKRGADMPGPSRSFFGCDSDYNQTVFVAGGHDEEKNALRSALLYDVINDKWVSIPDMEEERDECKAIFHAGKFHVISGYSTDRQGKFQNDAEVFNTATSTWCHVDDNFHQTDEMCSMPMVLNMKGKMFRCCAGSVELFEASVWQSVTQLPPDVCLGSVIMTWLEKMLVIGSDKFGGTQNMYVLELKGNKFYCWTKVGLPLEFTGSVQAGCSLEI